MEWLNPIGGWAWAGIPIVIALYLLRRKAAQHEVSSLLLWQKMAYNEEALRPFQKLRKQWLLLLQLLLVALLALALMRPAGTGGLHGEMVMIFDVSASMKTKSDGRTRIQEAVRDAMDLVDGMQEGDTVTILTAGQTLQQRISRSTDKQRIKASLASLEAENGIADIEGALSLALAMQRDLPELAILLFSDTYQAETKGVQIRTTGQGEDNRSVVSLRCGEQEEGMTAFARVANYGVACEITLECYADGVLCDLRTITLEQGGQQSVQMQVPGPARVVWVEITTEDALMEDNVHYWVWQEPTERKALLVTDGNIFLEKALLLREDIQLYKTTLADVGEPTGYDLYLFDGALPEVLPTDGSILALHPNGQLGSIRAGENKQSEGRLRAAANAQGNAMTQNLALSEISLRSYQPLTGGQSVLTWGEDTLLAVEEQAGQRMAALGFDLHDSNLPMQTDFPILVQNLMEYLLPGGSMAVESAVCGQPISLVLDKRAESGRIITPSGKEIEVQGDQFKETMEIGIYTLIEKRAGDREQATAFALHIPPVESDVRFVYEQEKTEIAERTGQTGTGKEWTPYFLLAFLILLVVEWEVSRRGA